MPSAKAEEKLDKLDDRLRKVEALGEKLTERIDNIRRETPDRERVAVAESRLDQLEQRVDRAGNRGWSFVQMLAAAVLGAVLTLAVQFLLAYLGVKKQ